MLQETPLRLGVACGGPSPEHRISLISSRHIVEGASRDRFEVVVLGVDMEGRWFAHELDDYLIHPGDPKRVALAPNGRPVTPARLEHGGCFLALDGSGDAIDVDVVFPVMHGPFGEDGKVQGVLEALGIPYVGCGVTASALCMDKHHAKCSLRKAGIDVADWVTLRRDHPGKPDYKSLLKLLGGPPVFVKPANMGSSVGVTKVESEGRMRAAVEKAFGYDDKALVEPAVVGRELECAVLGAEAPEASDVAEIVPKKGFYSYDAKYIDDSAAELILRADLDDATREKIREVAVRAFTALGCRGLARVDFFLRDDGKVIVNEVNTMPGFTKISMYPKLWELAGVPIETLVDRLVDIALATKVEAVV